MQGRMQEFPRARYFLRLAAVFLLYLAAGKLGLSVPFTSGNVSPVWPASGVALAAVLLWGYGTWPGIAAASFLVNFWSPIPPLAALGLAVGNTSSALVGGYLLRRIAGLETSLVKLHDVLALVTLGALASTPVLLRSERPRRRAGLRCFSLRDLGCDSFWCGWRLVGQFSDRGDCRMGHFLGYGPFVEHSPPSTMRSCCSCSSPSSRSRDSYWLR